MSASSAFAVCMLALENFGVSDLNLSRNEFREVGAKAATRLLMSNDRLQRVDLHDCKLGALGLAEVSKGIISAAAGTLSSVALAFNLFDDEASRAAAPELTTALSALLASSVCPSILNLSCNALGKVLGTTMALRLSQRVWRRDLRRSSISIYPSTRLATSRARR